MGTSPLTSHLSIQTGKFQSTFRKVGSEVQDVDLWFSEKVNGVIESEWGIIRRKKLITFSLKSSTINNKRYCSMSFAAIDPEILIMIDN